MDAGKTCTLGPGLGDPVDPLGSKGLRGKDPDYKKQGRGGVWWSLENRLTLVIKSFPDKPKVKSHLYSKSLTLVLMIWVEGGGSSSRAPE